MTVYTVDKHYGKDDKIYYEVYPYDLKGTLDFYFGIDWKNFCLKFSFYPWYLRYTGFFDWIKRTRFSKKKAIKLKKKIKRKKWTN